MRNKIQSTEVCPDETVNFSHTGNFLARSIERNKRDCYGLKSKEICAATHIGSNSLSNVKKGYS